MTELVGGPSPQPNPHRLRSGRAIRLKGEGTSYARVSFRLEVRTASKGAERRRLGVTNRAVRIPDPEFETKLRL